MSAKTSWKPAFFTIAAGQAVSLIGSAGVQFALIWWLTEKTASPMMLGLAGLAAYLPMAFLSPFAGVAADRYNRRTICITADLSMGLLALLYAGVLHFLDAPVWSVLVLLFLRGIGGTFHQPSIQSLIPQLVPADQLVRVNGWMQLMISGSFILGPVIGAALYAVVPLSVILLTDVVGAVLASAALVVAKIPPLERQQTEVVGFVRQFREGMAVYAADRRLFRLVIAESLCMFFFAPLSSFYPLMTSQYFGLSALHGSVVETTFAVGMLLSALLFGSVLKIRRKITTSYIGLLGIGLSSMLSGLLPPVFGGWIGFAILCACLGAFGNVHSIPMTAYMQETIEPEKMGRAFSLLALMGSLTMPVGLLFSSPFAERLGVHVWFFVSGAGILLIVALVLLTGRLRRKKTI